MNASRPERGFHVYSKATLSVYNWLVLDVLNRFVWRCPTTHLCEHYRRNLGACHLDLGVGTGYFLRQFPPGEPVEQLVLVDANPNCLERSRQCLANWRPTSVKCNLLNESELSGLDQQLTEALRGRSLDSIAASYLIHCLPGGVDRAGPLIAWCANSLGSGGVLFGATIMADLPGQRFSSRRLMNLFQRRGIFGNANDTIGKLRALLEMNFSQVKTHTRGSVVLFSARNAQGNR